MCLSSGPNSEALKSNSLSGRLFGLIKPVPLWVTHPVLPTQQWAITFLRWPQRYGGWCPKCWSLGSRNHFSHPDLAALCFSLQQLWPGLISVFHHSSSSLLVSVTDKMQPSHFASEETGVQRDTWPKPNRGWQSQDQPSPLVHPSALAGQKQPGL